jgi:hypothetical protein
MLQFGWRIAFFDCPAFALFYVDVLSLTGWNSGHKCLLVCPARRGEKRSS